MWFDIQAEQLDLLGINIWKDHVSASDYYFCGHMYAGDFTNWDVSFTASDYYQLDDLLTPEEKAIRMKVRECMEKEVAPIMTKVFL